MVYGETQFPIGKRRYVAGRRRYKKRRFNANSTNFKTLLLQNAPIRQTNTGYTSSAMVPGTLYTGDVFDLHVSEYARPSSQIAAVATQFNAFLSQTNPATTTWVRLLLIEQKGPVKDNAMTNDMFEAGANNNNATDFGTGANKRRLMYRIWTKNLRTVHFDQVFKLTDSTSTYDTERRLIATPKVPLKYKTVSYSSTGPTDEYDIHPRFQWVYFIENHADDITKQAALDGYQYSWYKEA